MSEDNEAERRVEVEDNPSEQRWEARLDGELAGFVVYRLDETDDEPVVDLVHTEVDNRFEGHGIGSALARAALDGARREGSRRVVASCPFIAAWIERHPDYTDLLATSTETR
ncbi:MAG: hypothetical protein JWR42_2548 [Marmoricola sp.]|nr:hypothetical protein [Marmoricola sp.]